MKFSNAVFLALISITTVACGGGGGGSSSPTPHTPVAETPEKPKPEPVTTCTEWEQSKDGKTESRSCEKTLQEYVLSGNVWVKGDVTVLEAWTEKREVIVVIGETDTDGDEEAETVVEAEADYVDVLTEDYDELSPEEQEEKARNFFLTAQACEEDGKIVFRSECKE